MFCTQAGEYFIENVLKGKGSETRAKKIISAESHPESTSVSPSST